LFRENGGLGLRARAGLLLFVPNGNRNRTHRHAAKRIDGLRKRSAGVAAVMFLCPVHWNVLQRAYCSRHAKWDFFYDREDCVTARGVSLCAMAALTDNTTTVAELKTRVLAFARERDWEQFHSPKNLSMALAAEAAELMEHFLWATPEQSRTVAADAAKRRKIAEELADVVIYSLEFANITGLDLAAAIETKMAANAQKYPVEKARGRADKYTEL
jgi:dCTP diphosphatase